MRVVLFPIFILVANLSCFPSIPPESIEELSTEQGRQITKCMVAFHEETLESVTTSLKADNVLYDFFGKKKGKKYKVSKGICTLARLKSFVSKLQDDIDEMTSNKDELISTRDKFKDRTIEEVEFDINFFSFHIKKLTTVKSHVEALIAITIPRAVTLETAWKYFESHREDYLPSIPVAEIADFKPRFFAHVRRYYGLE